MKETLVKGALSAGVAGIASSIIFGNTTVQIFGTTASGAIVTAGAVGLGSVASDLVAENLIEQMNLPQNIKSTEEFLLRSGVCGLASTGVLMYAGIPSSEVPAAFVLGAASKAAGDYADEKLFGKRGMIMPLF